MKPVWQIDYDLRKSQTEHELQPNLHKYEKCKYKGNKHTVQTNSAR